MREWEGVGWGGEEVWECVLGTLLGGMLGVVIVLIRHYARSEAAD